MKGIPQNEFTHVIREDPAQKGMLYAGTERGMYVSFNDGESWQPLQLNLPVTPVHDIALQAGENDLVVATHGRSFWILDDLTPLYQLKNITSGEFLFKPHHTYRIDGGTFDRPGLALGKNPPGGTVITYYLKHQPKEKDSLKLEFLENDGKIIKTFIGKPTKKGADQGGDEDETPVCPADSGVNRFVWDMRYPDATKVPGAIMWGGTTQGPLVMPGTYQVRLNAGGKTLTQSFEIRKDPRVHTTPEEFKEQFDFLMKIRDKVSEIHEAVNTIRDIRKQTDDLVKRLEKHLSKDSVANSAKRMNDKLKKIEEEMIQVKIKSGQDALNYPIKLNDKIASISGVVASADARPTAQAHKVYDDLTAKLESQLSAYKQILEADFSAFNATVKTLDVPAVILKPAGGK